MGKWYALGTLAAVAVGWGAALVHLSGHAPVGIVSLAVGCTLGALLGAIAAGLRLTGKRHLIVGTLLLAALTILTEHAWLYRDFRQQWHAVRAQSPQAALFRPEEPWSPAEYVRHELTPARAVLWMLDAVLIAAAAAITAVAVRRRLAIPET